MYSYGPLHMAEQNQLEHTYSSYVRIRDVALKTLPEAMNDREKWWEKVKHIRASGTTWWWWWLVSWSSNLHKWFAWTASEKGRSKIALVDTAFCFSTEYHLYLFINTVWLFLSSFVYLHFRIFLGGVSGVCCLCFVYINSITFDFYS